MYLSEVQIQMVDIAAYHCVEGHPAPFVVKPIVVEFGLVNNADSPADSDFHTSISSYIFRLNTVPITLYFLFVCKVTQNKRIKDKLNEKKSNFRSFLTVIN